MAKKTKTSESGPSDRAVSDGLERRTAPPCSDYLSTGSALLDLAIADRYPGGAGVGRIIQISGDNSTAKTVLCQQILGSAQRKGGTAVYEDVEMTLDLDRALLFGMDTGGWPDFNPDGADKLAFGDFAKAAKVGGKFVLRYCPVIEQLFDKEIVGALDLLDKKEMKGPVAMGVDTLAALTCKAELERDMDKGTYAMDRAKHFSTGYRKLINRITRNNLTIVCIDQTRTNVGASPWAKKHTTSGGKAIGFYASTRVHLKQIAKLKNKHDQVVGVKIAFEIEKNKIAPPFRTGWFDLIFDYGIDDLGSNIDWLAKQKVPSLVAVAPAKDDEKKDSKKGKDKKEKGTGWLLFEDKKYRKADLVKLIEGESREEEIAQEVVRVWREVYETPERKPRY